MTKYQQINNDLEKLFESDNSNKVLFNITGHSPLTPVQNTFMFQHCIDPLTGTYYDGVYLAGEFASIGVLNNNNRKYVKSNYIELIQYLREQIHTIGVYGELEHPDKYPVNYNKASHKIVDIWYDEDTDKVMGVIVLLDTPAGRKAKQIVKSGGKLALSGRGGGDEIENPDGTITAFLRLLVTFDIVSTPGFTTARQEFIGNGLDLGVDQVKLNMYFPKGSKLTTSEQEIISVDAEEYSVLNESVNMPDVKQKQQSGNKGNQQQSQASSKKQQQDTEVLQQGDDAEEQKLENKLSKQVDQTLNESLEFMQQQVVRKDKHKGLFTMDTSAGSLSDVNYVTESETEFDQFLKENSLID